MRKLLILLGLFLPQFPVRAQLVTLPNAGLPPFSSIDAGVADAVNRSNLNANFSIPIYSGTGRGQGLSLALSYNSSIWNQTVYNGNYVWSPVPGANASVNWGWNTFDFGGGVFYQQQTGIQCATGYWTTNYNSFFYIERNGTTHSFPAVSLTYTPSQCTGSGWSGTSSGVANDGGGYYLSAPNAVPTVYQKDGTKISAPLTYPGNTTIYDTNGNYVSTSYAGGGETDVLDTVGRTALKMIASSSTSTLYKYQDTTGTYQTITLTLQSFNIKTNFGCQNVGEYTSSNGVYLPVSVAYPNGTQYSISYEATPSNSGYITGRVSKLTLPNGGYVQYTYGTTNDGVNCMDGTTLNLTRTVYDGTNTNVWTFARSQNNPTTETYPQMPYDSAANQSVYTFGGMGNEETAQKIYQGSSASGTLLRTINTTWAGNSTPATQTTILEDNSTQSEVETTYDNYGNLDLMKEHDFGSGSPGSVLRTTNYTYLSTTAYTNLNIVNRVTEKTLADSTGTVKYREDTAYDGTTISPCPTGIPQHDDSGHGCTFTTRGNPTSFTTYTNAATPSGPETKNSYYDMFGNLVQQDADCCVSIFRNLSATTEYSAPDSIVRGPSGGTQLTSSLTHSSYTGQIASITDPSSQVTSYTNDSMRRPKTMTRPDTSQISYTYNDTTHTVTTNSPVDSSHSINKVNYVDGLGQMIKSSTADASQNIYAIAQHLYDPVGRDYQQSNPYTSSPQYWVAEQYDALGRRTKRTLQDNSQFSYTYSTNTVTSIDPAGHQRKTQSDGLGRLSVFTEPDHTNSNSLTLQTTYAYSVLNQALTITQGSQTRTFNYDGMGRLTSEVHPENGTTNYQYNSFDRVSQRSDNRGVITTYSYDTANRLHQVSYNVGTTGVPATPTVTYTYGTTPSQYNNGLLITMADGTGNTAYTYDVMGRKTQESHTIGTTAYPVSYQYNYAGEVTSATYPSGRAVKPTYDAIGRFSSLADTSATYLSGMAYNSVMQPTGFTLGNGASASMTYSADRLQPNAITYSKSGTTLFGQSYTYGLSSANNGEMTAITDSVDTGRNMTYTYDSLDRLSNAKSQGSTNYPAWGLSFTYDRYGNRTGQSISSGCTGLTCPTSSVTVSATTNRLTSSPYTYDANGNMTNDAVNTTTYDAENRVVSAAGASGTATYSYDGMGRRVQKTFGGATTTYVLAANDVLSEYSGSTLSNEYIRVGGNLIAEYNSGTLTYHGRDPLSIRLSMNASGSTTGEQGHFPFGESWYNTNTTTKWHFTAYERDAESGNDHATFRYHVNRLGRFSAVDPARPRTASPQALSRYPYAAADPINRSDPSGQMYLPNPPVSVFCPLGGDDNPESFPCIPCDSFMDPICPYGGPGGGGGGGGVGCSDGQACGDPEPSPPPPPSPQPQCFCQVKYRYFYVDVLGKQLGPYTHSFWYLQTPGGTPWILAAEPTSRSIGAAYLNSDIRQGPGIWVGDDTPGNGIVWFNTGVTTSSCSNTWVMINSADAWPNYTYLYDPLGKWGPNSNSFTHFLANAGGVVVSPPPLSVGWNFF
jgi:RHS repeat-associated protein